MDLNIKIRFGLPESTEAQFELMTQGMVKVAIDYGRKHSLKKDIHLIEPTDNVWRYAEVPYGGRMIIVNELNEVIAWKSIVTNEDPLKGSLRKL